MKVLIQKWVWPNPECHDIHLLCPQLQSSSTFVTPGILLWVTLFSISLSFMLSTSSNTLRWVWCNCVCSSSTHVWMKSIHRNFHFVSVQPIWCMLTHLMEALWLYTIIVTSLYSIGHSPLLLTLATVSSHKVQHIFKIIIWIKVPCQND